jgi:hypothetical protein
VTASAAQREDVVYTSDFEDLSRLRDQYFRGAAMKRGQAIIEIATATGMLRAEPPGEEI